VELLLLCCLGFEVIMTTEFGRGGDRFDGFNLPLMIWHALLYDNSTHMVPFSSTKPPPLNFTAVIIVLIIAFFSDGCKRFFCTDDLSS